jgi:hypothetical protein
MASSTEYGRLLLFIPEVLRGATAAVVEPSSLSDSDDEIVAVLLLWIG